VIQHDGAPAHVGKGNAQYWPTMLAARYRGRKIKIVTQPAQSPDLNVLDLGFFNSLAHLTADEHSDSLSELLTAVEECYWSYPTDTLERVWQMQFNVYNSILQARGDNIYKMPHVGTTQLQRKGELKKQNRAKKEHLTACKRLCGIAQYRRVSS
jgi:hypothetical protein